MSTWDLRNADLIHLLPRLQRGFPFAHCERVKEDLMSYIAVWTAPGMRRRTALAVLLGSLPLGIVQANAGVIAGQRNNDFGQFPWGADRSNRGPIEFYLTDPGKTADPWMPGWITVQKHREDAAELADAGPKGAPDSDGGRAGAIPLPNAAWSGLSCLAGLTLAGGVRRVHRSLRRLSASM